MKASTLGNIASVPGEKQIVGTLLFGGVMAARWILGLVSGLVFVIGLAYQLYLAALVALIGLLGAVVVRPGRNPLAAAYRDVLPADRRRDW